MATPKPKKSAQPDRKTVCLGEMLPEVLAALKAKKERNLSALVRQALRVYLHPDQKAVDPRPLLAALDQLRLDLSRVGGNLNQLAHGFNMHGPAAFNRDALAASHDELREEFRKVIAKLLEVERGIRRANR